MRVPPASIACTAVAPRKSADPALQGKRRVKQCLPLKSSSNVSLLQSLPQNVSNDVVQATFLQWFPEILSLNVILALTPSLLFFYLRGESERGSWGPDYPQDPPP